VALWECQAALGLTWGQAVGLSIAMPRKQLSTFATIPALVTIIVASHRLLAYCTHSSLLLHPFACLCVIAKYAEGAFWLQSYTRSGHYFAGAVIRTMWPMRCSRLVKDQRTTRFSGNPERDCARRPHRRARREKCGDGADPHAARLSWRCSNHQWRIKPREAVTGVVREHISSQ
jgi:hypothetical protein